MANFVFGSVTFSALSGAVSGGTYQTGKFWYGDSLIGTPQYDRRRMAYPGLNGSYVKKMGFRGQPIMGHVLYINTTVGNVIGAWETDVSALKNTTFDVTPPGADSYEDCELIDFTTGKFYHSPGGKFLMLTSIGVYSLTGKSS